MQYGMKHSGDGVLSFKFGLWEPVYALFVPNHRYDGQKVRIVAVGEEFLVLESCRIFDGKCPKQGLSLNVFTRRKQLSPEALVRVKTIVNTATSFRFENLDVVEHSEDFPFQSDANRLIMKLF